MITDKRKQKQKIVIEFEKIDYDGDLNDVVDRIADDIDIVVNQRDMRKLKTSIFILDN